MRRLHEFATRSADRLPRVLASGEPVRRATPKHEDAVLLFGSQLAAEILAGSRLTTRILRFRYIQPAMKDAYKLTSTTVIKDVELELKDLVEESSPGGTRAPISGVVTGRLIALTEA